MKKPKSKAKKGAKKSIINIAEYRKERFSDSPHNDHIQWIEENVSDKTRLEDISTEILNLEGDEVGPVLLYLVFWIMSIKDNTQSIELNKEVMAEQLDKFSVLFQFENLKRGKLLESYSYDNMTLIEIFSKKGDVEVKFNMEHPMNKKIEGMSPADRKQFLKIQGALIDQHIAEQKKSKTQPV